MCNVYIQGYVYMCNVYIQRCPGVCSCVTCIYKGVCTCVMCIYKGAQVFTCNLYIQGYVYMCNVYIQRCPGVCTGVIWSRQSAHGHMCSVYTQGFVYMWNEYLPGTYTSVYTRCPWHVGRGEIEGVWMRVTWDVNACIIIHRCIYKGVMCIWIHINVMGSSNVNVCDMGCECVWHNPQVYIQRCNVHVITLRCMDECNMYIEYTFMWCLHEMWMPVK